jgi:L,D-transpeptidase catalytic domain
MFRPLLAVVSALCVLVAPAGGDVAMAARRPPPRPPRLAPQYDDVAAPVRPEWVDSASCPAQGHAAVVDRAHQWAWLCGDGRVTRDFPMTSARSQPDPGTYDVYAKDMRSSSTISGAYSEMTHFVAFSRGKFRGARIAFHSVPTYRDGSYVQPLDSVGSPELFGASAGCLRVRPDDAVAVWDWLAMGDDVIVVS